jgi:hypothetical protein
MTLTASVTQPAAVPGGERNDSLRVLTRKLAGIVITLSALGRLVMNLQGYYLIDDYAFIARASRSDALTWTVLMEPHQGHVMPAAHLVTWVLQAAAPWNYVLPALAMAAGWLMCLLLIYRLLTRWLGTVPVILIPLVFYAVTPLTVQTTTWWSAAMNAIPIQLCALLGVYLLLPLAHGAQRVGWRRQAGVLACAVVALMFFSKAIVLPILFVGVAVAWSPGRARAAWLRAWRAAPLLWLILVALPLGYGLTYLSLFGSSRPSTASFSALDLLIRSAQSVTGALLPSWAGGPLDFTPGGDPWGQPPTWVTGLAVASLAACTVLVVRGGTRSRRLAIVALAYAAGCIVLVSVGRQGYIPVSAGALRYFADLAVPLTLLLASLAQDSLGPQPRRALLGRWLTAGACVFAVGALSMGTTLRLADNPDARAVRDVAQASLASLQAESGGPLLDQWAPPKVLMPWYGEYARSSRLYAGVPSGVRFAEQGAALRIWDDAGRLLPARIEGPSARRLAPCPSTGEGDSRAMLSLNGTVLPFTHAVEIRATSQRPTTIRMSIGEGPPETWSLPGGPTTAYRYQVTGPSPEVLIESDAAAAACVTSIRVGTLVPSEEGS